MVRRRTYSKTIEPLLPLDAVALASISPRRRELLTSLALRVEIVPSVYEEAAVPGVAPRDLAVRHARGKAAGATSSLLLVAADTVVDIDGVALGKPADAVEAAAMLRQLSGRWHDVHTAFALRDDRTACSLCEVVTTRVRFADLAKETIDAYVASGDPFDKAGAYGIQGFAATLVERIEGDYFTVVGFPLAAFAAALPRCGYRLVPPGTRTERLLTEVHA